MQAPLTQALPVGSTDVTCHFLQSGSKLLFAEVKIALRLINKTMHGHSLTRCVILTSATPP